jgi:hypothetical protein
LGGSLEIHHLLHQLRDEKATFIAFLGDTGRHTKVGGGFQRGVTAYIKADRTALVNRMKVFENKLLSK